MAGRELPDTAGNCFPLLSKNTAMRASSLLLLILFSSCVLLEPALPMGYPRAWEHSRSRGLSQDDVSAEQRPDTAFYVSAISFPPSYDWQKDTAFGATACTLKFFRGTEQLLSVCAGPSQRISAHPDRHHIIDGKLYTEYFDSHGTTVKCNGETVAEWSGSESLLGILHKDGVLHTLGRGPSSLWFTYRRDGVPLMKVEGGEVFGGFDSCTCGPTGAIYEDGGAVCFAYKTSTGGVQRAYLVRDGVPEMMLGTPSVQILDIKQIGGGAAAFYREKSNAVLSFRGKPVDIYWGGRIIWVDGEILSLSGSPSVVGHFNRPLNARLNYGVGGEGFNKNLQGGSDFFYYGLDENELLSFNQPRPGWESYYFFNRHCACMVGSNLAAVLTPRGRGTDLPFLAFGKDTLRYNLYGFLSGVSVKINN